MPTKQYVPVPLIAITVLISMSIGLFIPDMPTFRFSLTLMLLGLILVLISQKRWWLVVAIAITAFGYLGVSVNQHKSHALPLDLEAQTIRVKGRVVSIVQHHENKNAQFRFAIDQVIEPAGKWLTPGTVQLSWQGAMRRPKPGEIWELPVRLRRPRNYANPGSFDSEKYYFQQRIVATGSVFAKGAKHYLGVVRFSQIANKVRQNILHFLDYALGTHEFRGIITALLLGEKYMIQGAHNKIMQNAGVAHLMAISGLHVGLIAMLSYSVLRFVRNVMPNQLLRIILPCVLAIIVLVLSCTYGLLSGFGVATQRAVIMIAVYLGGIIYKRDSSKWQKLSIALLVVLLCDPFVILSVGFWLSFIAVIILFYAVRFEVKHNNLKNWLWSKIKPNLLMGLGLFPVTLYFFGQASLIAPVANMFAIPWVSFSVVPLCFIILLLIPFNQPIAALFAKFAANNFALLWPVLERFDNFPVYIFNIPTQYRLISLFSAGIGFAWLFAPRGIPARWCGLIGFLPLFFIPHPVVPHAQAQFTLLDVGQGLAAVVQTKTHTLLYDTGAKLSENFDMGSRVVAPFLHTKGITYLDTIIISHADNDHIGGLKSILENFNAKQILASQIEMISHPNTSNCYAGQQWNWDGVTFTMLHPQINQTYKQRNNQSCVLHIQAGEQSILLTGDIEQIAEQKLLATYNSKLHADIMLVPHHGSKTSSSLEFIQTVNPKVALIPAGYKNRYGHPKLSIIERYQEQGVQLFDTIQAGAISFTLGDPVKKVLVPQLHRSQQVGFWLTLPG